MYFLIIRMIQRSAVLYFIVVFVTGYEYILNYDRLELAYYEKSLVKDEYFLFRKYNRTNFCLNLSMTLLEDLDGNKMEFTTRIYQLLNNQYKPMGMVISFNVCEYWKKNIYGTTEHLAHYGNLEGCDIKKGHYYLYNYMPEEKFFPKFVPFGSFMVEIYVKSDTQKPVLKFQWYVTSKFKVKNSKFFSGKKSG